MTNANTQRGFIPLENETGEFLISPYGSHFAFGFRGDAKFAERCCNFLNNFGLNSRPLTSALGTNCIYYVCLTIEKLEKALNEYYYGRVIGDGIVAPNSFETVEDIELPLWDDKEVKREARKMTDAFMRTCLKHESFMANIDKEVYSHEYAFVG